MRTLLSTLSLLVLCSSIYAQGFLSNPVKGSKLCDDHVYIETYIDDTLQDNLILNKIWSLDVATKIITINFYFSSQEGTTSEVVEVDIYDELPDPEEGTPNPLGNWSLDRNYYYDNEKILVLTSSFPTIDPYSTCYEQTQYDCDSIQVIRKERRYLCPTHETFTFPSFYIKNDTISVGFTDRRERLENVCLGDGWRVHSDTLTIDADHLEEKIYDVVFRDTTISPCQVPPCPVFYDIKEVGQADMIDCVINDIETFEGKQAPIVYPNPTTGQIMIPNHKGELRLNDSFSKTYTISGSENYDLSDMPDGIYFLQIEINGDLKTVKVVKE